MTAQFDNIFKGLASQPGSKYSLYTFFLLKTTTRTNFSVNLILKLELRIAASGLGWKASEGEDNVTTVASSDIKWIQWIRLVPYFILFYFIF